MDVKGIGSLIELKKLVDTFIVVIRNPDGTLSRVKSVDEVECQFFDDGTFCEYDPTTADESEEDYTVYRCMEIESDEPHC